MVEAQDSYLSESWPCLVICGGHQGKLGLARTRVCWIGSCPLCARSKEKN